MLKIKPPNKEKDKKKKTRITYKYPATPALSRLHQEIHKQKASLNYLHTVCFRKVRTGLLGPQPTPLIPAPRRQRPADPCESQDGMVYTLGSGPCRVTETLSIETKQETKTKYLKAVSSVEQ